MKASFLRVTAGFLLAAAMALPIGLAMGAFKVWEGLLQPLTEFVRYIPVPALIPICMVIFGIEERSKIALIWAGTFFQLVLMVAEEIRRVPYDMLQISYTLGASRWQVVRRVMWRAAKPGIFDALRLCNGWAWSYVVIVSPSWSPPTRVSAFASSSSRDFCRRHESGSTWCFWGSSGSRSTLDSEP